jgi:hypothetical protein
MTASAGSLTVGDWPSFFPEVTMAASFLSGNEDLEDNLNQGDTAALTRSEAARFVVYSYLCRVCLRASLSLNRHRSASKIISALQSPLENATPALETPELFEKFVLLRVLASWASERESKEILDASFSLQSGYSGLINVDRPYLFWNSIATWAEASRNYAQENACDLNRLERCLRVNNPYATYGLNANAAEKG